MKIEIYEYKQGWKRTKQYGWRLVAGNGEIMASGMGFNTKQNAMISIKKIYRYFKHDFRVADLLT